MAGKKNASRLKLSPVTEPDMRSKCVSSQSVAAAQLTSLLNEALYSVRQEERPDRHAAEPARSGFSSGLWRRWFWSSHQRVCVRWKSSGAPRWPAVASRSVKVFLTVRSDRFAYSSSSRGFLALGASWPLFREPFWGRSRWPHSWPSSLSRSESECMRAGDVGPGTGFRRVVLGGWSSKTSCSSPSSIL